MGGGGEAYTLGYPAMNICSSYKVPSILRRHSWPEQWQQCQVTVLMQSQLVPGSRGAFLSTVTSHGWQNALQKSRPLHIGRWRHCSMDSPISEG